MKLKVKKVLVSCLISLILIFLYIFVKKYLFSLTEKGTISLNDHWDITINSKEYKNINIDNFTFPVTNKGDVIVMKTKLPENKKVNHGMIQCRTYHCVIDAYLNNECVYSYGSKLANDNKMVGSGYYWFVLNDKYQNKELKIVLNVTENNVFSNVKGVLLENESDCIKNLIINNLIEIFICLFLFVIGICCLLVLLYTRILDREHRILLYISLFSISISLWMVCGYGIIEVLTNNHSLMAYIEFLSLYFAPIPILLFLNEIMNKRYLKVMLKALIIINAIFEIIGIIFNSLNIFHYPDLLAIFHVLMILESIVLFICSISQINENKTLSENILSRGVIILIILVIIDVSRFYIGKFLKFNDSISNNSLVPLGVLTFIVSMFGSYLYNLVDFYYKAAEKKSLLKMAFTDVLTKIPNRTKCEDMFNQLEHANIPLTVINFDLNNFKYVNDTFGHIVGDKLLIEFARILAENYKDIGFVGRMGGDEFIVLLKNNNESYIVETLISLKQKINEANNLNNEFSISTAYGYETNKNNINRSIWNMYEMADKKMYKCKEQYKSRNN